MMKEEAYQAGDKISTGTPGLDAVLHGGFVPAGFYLAQGDPGSGKTTLALQYLLEVKRRGESGLYVTLTESVRDIERTCQAYGWDFSELTVFDLTQSRANLNAPQSNTVFYPSEIELGDTTQQIIAEVERLQPQHVVFDGLSELRLLSADPLRYRHQILALKHFFEQKRITVLLLDDRTSPAKGIPSETLVGGNLVLERELPGYGAMRRRLQVTKVRGAAFHDGYHDYEITDEGVVVYPRLSFAVERAAAFLKYPLARTEYSSGVRALDAMTGGGLESGSTTLLMGPSGVGKSTVAMQYASTALKRGEKVAVYIFDETLATFFERTEKLCLGGIRQYIETGLLYAQQINPAELSPGGFAQEARRAAAAGAKMVILDSINGYINAMPEERFLSVHLHELFTYLNHQGVVTLAVVTQHGMVRLEQTQIDVSYLADSVLLFRHFEAQGQIRKALSMLKKRTGPHESTLRELRITEQGISVGEPLAAFHGIMSGAPEYKGDAGSAAGEKVSAS